MAIAMRKMAPPFMSDASLRAVLKALPSARVVGGAVRDAMAGRPVADIDLATPDPPGAVIAALDAAGLKHAPTGLQHGTVTAIAGGRGFEITTLRRDEATDGRHAEVAWTDDWREDAARRDFTINAMSMSPDGTVYDYFGGVDDLQAGRVRFVSDAAARIREDYLRVLRYFRFYGRYAAEPPDPATEAALREGAAGLSRLSVERVWSELKRILTLPDPVPTLQLMRGLGVLAAAFPGALDVMALDRLVKADAPVDAMLRLSALRRGGAAGLADRFKLSRAELARLEAFDGPAPDPAWSDGALRRVLAEEPAEAIVGRTWLAGGAGPEWGALRGRLAAAKRPVFPLAGRDVVALGVGAGPRVGELLQRVRAWWMAGGCVATAAECRAELARLAAGC